MSSISTSSSVSSSQKRAGRRREERGPQASPWDRVNAAYCDSRIPAGGDCHVNKDTRGMEVELYYDPQGAQQGAMADMMLEGDVMAPRVHHLRPVPECQTAANSPLEPPPAPRTGGHHGVPQAEPHHVGASG